jgi:hypothetical protein
MAKYRGKPIEIDAWLVEDILWAAEHSWNSLPEEIVNAYNKGGWVFLTDGTIHIPTPEGVVVAYSGDFIIRDIHGKFKPISPDRFWELYERVEE